MSGPDAVRLIEGATYLMTNEYEKSLLESKTGLTAPQLLDRVEIQVTTLGKDGVVIEGRDLPASIRVPVVRDVNPSADPTGIGDAFRAGFVAGLSWRLGLERAAQVGSLLAALVLETVGSQEYEVRPDGFVKRFAESYGDAAAAELRPHLPS
jgi:adenosine kinase